MKKLLLFSLCPFAFLLTVSLPACQKAGVNLNTGLPSLDSAATGPTNPPPSSSSYYITVSIDGVAKSFNAQDLAIKQTISALTAIDISGSVVSGGLEGMGLSIDNGGTGNPIVAGSYSQLGTGGFDILGDYNPGGGITIVYGAGEYLDTINPLKITITSIDSKTIKGTFSGDFYYTNTTTAQIGPDKKVFSDGAFYVPF